MEGNRVVAEDRVAIVSAGTGLIVARSYVINSIGLARDSWQVLLDLVKRGALCE